MSAKPEICPDQQTLLDYGLGKIDAARFEPVRRHLEHCAHCRHVVSSAAADTFLRRLQSANVEPLAEPPDSPGMDITSTYVADESIVNDPNHKRPSADPSKNDDVVSAVLAKGTDYEMLRQLGGGGMGTVYLARNRIMDRVEVLKVVNRALLERPQARQRFQQEIREAARLSHPNIVAAYSVLQIDELLVLVMEYVRGSDLARVVKQRGPLPIANAAYYAHEVAQGLSHAHEKKMVHRDIKPSNLILALQEGKHVVKILDFGLAKATSEKAYDAGLTRINQILGTPEFMAPEQAANARDADIRADIYSLGCTCYFLLCGRPPFQSKNQYELLEMHHGQAAPPLDLLRPDVPAEFAEVVARMIAKAPADRYQTPKEVARALRPFFRANQHRSSKAEIILPQPVQCELIDAHPTPGGPVAVRPVASFDVFPLSVFSPAAQAAPRRILTVRTAAKRRRSLRPNRRAMLWAGGVLAGMCAIVAAMSVYELNRYGTLAITVNEPGAEIWIDGTPAPAASSDRSTSAEIRLSTGPRRLEVRKSGYRAVGETRHIASGRQPPWVVRLEMLEPRLALAPFHAAQARDYQNAWAKYLHVPAEQTNSLGMKFALIPPGQFDMGSTPEQVEQAVKMDDQFGRVTPEASRRSMEVETPQHRVRITKLLLMSRTELTIGAFRPFVEATGYVTEAEKGGGGGRYDVEAKKAVRDPKYTWKTPGYPATDECPAAINANDAMAFCNWLSEQEKLTPCYQPDPQQGWVLASSVIPNTPAPAPHSPAGYRLPTEAEWEYACRAGTATFFSSGDDGIDLERYDWYSVCSGRVAHPVGQKLPNAFGLYDMHANVHEWCQDWFAPDYYSHSPESDPAGPATGTTRVTRGGCVYADRRTCRSAHRSYRSADSIVAFETFGSRIVRELARSVTPNSKTPEAANQASASSQPAPGSQSQPGGSGPAEGHP